MGGSARDWGTTFTGLPLPGGILRVDLTMTKLFPPTLTIGWEVIIDDRGANPPDEEHDC